MTGNAGTRRRIKRGLRLRARAPAFPVSRSATNPNFEADPLPGALWLGCSRAESGAQGAEHVMSRDILTHDEGATGHALPAIWFAAADFLSGSGDSLLAGWRNG